MNMTKHDIEKFEKLDKNSAYWLGFLWADGSTDYQPDKSRYITRLMLASKDLEHLIKFRNYVAPHRKIYERKSYKAYEVQISNPTLSKNLHHLGIITDRAYNAISLPKLEISLISHFIRGYFDGDGTIGLYDNIDKRCSTIGLKVQLKITSINKNVILELHKILESNGIKANITLEKKRTVYHLVCASRASITNFIKYIYQDSNCNIRLERKYEKSMGIMEWYNNKGKPYSKSTIIRRRDTNCGKDGKGERILPLSI